jgi:hypothetical protein
MKVRTGLLAIVTIALALAIGTTGCSSSGRIGPEEFLPRAELERTPEPMHSSRLVGVSGDRAELEVWDEIASSNPRRRILWCPLSGLPPVIAKELRSGRNPWARGN